MSFLRNLKAPAGMTTRRSGLLPQIILPEVIFEKFKGPCGHDNPAFEAFALNHFWRMSFFVQLSILGRNHLLRKQQHDLLVFQKTFPKGRFSMLFGHNYFLDNAIRNFRRSNHTNSARRSSLEGWRGQKVGYRRDLRK